MSDKTNELKDAAESAWLDYEYVDGHLYKTTFTNGFIKGYDHASQESRLCLLLSDIRTALGDPEGKLMQEDFVEYCKEVVAERDRLREWVVS